MPRNDDHELPWGSHLRLEPRHNAAPVFVDDDTGMEWATIREAFWVGHLKGELEYGRVPDARLEMMHAVLAAMMRRDLHDQERATDLFRGNTDFAWWYVHWLRAEGFVRASKSGFDKPMAFGMSVLQMLAATRPASVGSTRPSVATIRQLGELGLGPEEREARLARLEQAAAKWDRAFFRKQIGIRPAVVLFRRGNGAIPMMQMVWSLTFNTEEQRDAFYEWLGLRLDRWANWAELLMGDTADRLTHRMLMVMAASLEDDTTNAPPIPLPA
ncbi:MULTISPECIES: hypothetical protein [Sphingomonas]|uniref:Uncharacterized protein n=1 Tax=Sphingomonas molluscorum TaxID=418184 RepID=A0ABU8Q518_9SPHN|nr:hypothetical protein [Sphingomonas sp. JUb134]MBM7406381.1 hypothetical protein [Sphingomonas sp. JUb134]